jgi:phage tail-like protein
VSAEPFTAFAFAVELRLPGSDKPLCEAAFAECEGLELRRAITTARDGGDGSVRLLPGAESFGNVTLRRGMTSGFDLWDWWERVRRDPKLRATCDVIVLSPDLASERVRFRLHRCLPARIAGPALDAAKNEVAIETLEIACEGVEIVGPGDEPRALPEPVARAELRELDASFEREINKARRVTVQFNPSELRTWISHELGSTMRLELQLTFDVDAPTPARGRPPDDVRRLTEKVAYFATPRPARRGGDDARRPAVRLAWGSFRFDGYVESLEETLEAFTPDGRPRRATLALALGRQQIAPTPSASASGPRSRSPGRR